MKRDFFPTLSQKTKMVFPCGFSNTLRISEAGNGPEITAF